MTGHGTAVALALTIGAATIPVPVLDVAELVEKSDVVVVGTVTAVAESGRGSVESPAGRVASRRYTATLRRERELKGQVPQTVSVAYDVPEQPLGFGAVRAGLHRTFFLKRSTTGFSFVSPYYPSVPAGLTAVPSEATTVIDRVAGSIAGVLSTPASSVPDRLEAVSALGRTRSSVSLAALREALKQPNQEIQVRAAIALLELHDVAGLAVAQKLLAQPAAYRDDLVQSVRNGIAQLRADEAAIPALTQLMSSNDTLTRRAAASALWHTASPKASASLTRGLDDSDREVRFYSVVGLATITGEKAWQPNMEEYFRNEPKFLEYWRRRVKGDPEPTLSVTVAGPQEYAAMPTNSRFSAELPLS